MVAEILSMPFPIRKRYTVQGALGGLGVTLVLFWLVCWAFRTLGEPGVWMPLLFTLTSLVIPFLMRNAYIKAVNEEVENLYSAGSKIGERYRNLKILRGWRIGELVAVVLLLVFALQR